MENPMKLNTTLALSLIAALSGLTVAENRAMENPVQEQAQPKEGAQQKAENSMVWIKNDNTTKWPLNWTIEVTVTRTVEAGGEVTKTRLDAGSALPLGEAQTLKSIEYSGYGEVFGKASKLYNLDFKNELKEGTDVVFKINSKEGVSGLIGWDVKVDYITPGTTPKEEKGEEEGEERISTGGPFDPWSLFSKKAFAAHAEAKVLELQAKAKDLDAYRLMMNLTTKYSLADLNLSFKTLSGIYDPKKAAKDDEADKTQREAATELIKTAYTALKEDLSK